ncbi:uroporphyrinogen-III synthase [Brachybacterium sp. EF45031]|uniref:uroporphyrinogen-III synthase n=1 Tax=Brachybacterium sillae TaxID=2810536 RepID=UPI00217E1D6E|nr:uroporphyrinogen-III synthase [Brachybacterium sillae]MCS6712088.1 uroporphyrinogen-III synthase [Brachybacterium sillae]
MTLRPRRALSLRPPRPAGPGNLLGEHLAAAGWELVERPVLRLESSDPVVLRPAVAALAAGRYALLVVPDARSLDAAVWEVPADTRVLALGHTAAETAWEHGLTAAQRVPRSPAALAAAAGAPTGRALLPRGATSGAALARALRAAGWEVDKVTAYGPVELTPDLPADVDAVIVTAPSQVRRLADLLTTGAAPEPLRTIPLVAIDTATAEAARRAGLSVAAVSEDGAETSLAAAVRTVGA